jgi:hypothetical protein
VDDETPENNEDHVATFVSQDTADQDANIGMQPAAPDNDEVATENIETHVSVHLVPHCRQD